MIKDDHVAVQGEQAAQHRRRRLPARPPPGQPAGPRAPCCSGISAPAKSICSDGRSLCKYHHHCVLPHRHPRPWNQNNSTTFISRSTSLISSPGFPLKALIGGRLGSCVHFVLTNWSRQFARVQDRRSRFSRFWLLKMIAILTMLTKLLGRINWVSKL